MPQPTISHHTSSTVIAWFWGLLAPIGIYAMLVCSTNHLQSLGVVIAWLAIQIGGNLAARDLLDDRFGDIPGSIWVIGRSLGIGIALLVIASPLNSLLPHSTNCL